MYKRKSSLVLILSALTALPAMGQEPSAYDLIPADASFVVRLQAPDQTVKDLANFVDKVQPGFGPFVESQAMAIGRVIQNATLAGVDRSKDWYLVGFANAEAAPEIVFLIPAEDVGALKDGVGDDFEFAEKSGLVAYSTEGDLIDQMKDCFDGKSKPISGRIDEPSRKEMAEGHLAAFINAASLKTTYAAELDDADEKLNEAIDALSRQVESTNPGVDMAYAMDMYRSMGACLLQAIRDSETAVLSIQATDSALQIDELLTVTSGSETDVFLKSQPLSEMPRLSTVPEGLSAYFGGSANPEPIMKWAGQLMDKVITDEEIRKKFEKSFATMREVQFGAVVGGFGMDLEQDAALQYFGLADVKPAAKLRSAMMEYQTETEYEIAGIKQKQSYKPDAEKIDDLSIDLYRLEQTMPPSLDPTGMQKAMNERLYGPDGMVQRMAFKGDLLMQTMGGGTEAIRKLASSSQWTSETLKAARARQHKEANFLLLGDLPNMLLDFGRIMLGAGALPVPIQAEQLDGLQLAPSYSGFSMAVAPQRLSVRTSLSVETFQGFAQIVAFIQGMRNQF